MGKCVSAGSELEEAGSSNTDQLIDVHESETNGTNKAVNKVNKVNNNNINNNNNNNNNNIDNTYNTGSLSESEDEPKPSRDGKSKSKSKSKPDANTTEKKEKERVKEIKKEEIRNNLNYVKPTEDELSKQQELELAHISHRGHFSNECEWSAQNMIQHNESHYVSLKSYHFNQYDENDNDWFIFKICSNNLIKVTSLTIYYAKNTLIQQYPSKISIQFMSENSLNKVLSANPFDGKQWSKPYIISPNPLCTKKPLNNINNINNQHSDPFIISICDEYLNKLRNNMHDQYIRISFINDHNDDDSYDGDKGKFAVHHLRLFGVDLLDENEENIILENTVSQQIENKNYKVDIDNNFQCKLSPKPGIKDARIMMREHIFFINTESKTILKLKQAICDEYNRFTKGNNTFQPKQLLLIEGGFGVINDMMDCTVLQKTLKEIGVKKGDKNTGYYITVAFC